MAELLIWSCDIYTYIYIYITNLDSHSHKSITRFRTIPQLDLSNLLLSVRTPVKCWYELLMSEHELFVKLHFFFILRFCSEFQISHA